MWCSRRRVASLGPVFVGDRGRGRVAGCFVALALLFAVVTKGDACFFSPPRRVQRWSSLAELLLPASSLTRNTRNAGSPPSRDHKVKEERRGTPASSCFAVAWRPWDIARSALSPLAPDRQPISHGLHSPRTLLNPQPARGVRRRVLRDPEVVDLKHFELAARGLLSFLSLLRASLLNVAKRNQARGQPGPGQCARHPTPFLASLTPDA